MTLSNSPKLEAPLVAVPLVTSLLRTSTRGRIGQSSDVLSTLDSAKEWLSRIAPQTHQVGPAIRIYRSDLEPLCAFRETLRRTLRAGRSPSDAGETDYHASAELRWTLGAGLQVRPLQPGWKAIAALATVELAIADANGSLRRVKTCARDECGFPFFDQSRNVSRMWHDSDTCGNLMNLRASRARRASAIPSGKIGSDSD